jgi:hypothetical protein
MSRDDVKAAKEGFTEDVSRLEEVFQGSYLWGGVDRETMRDHRLLKGLRELDMLNLQIFKV